MQKDLTLPKKLQDNLSNFISPSNHTFHININYLTQTSNVVIISYTMHQKLPVNTKYLQQASDYKKSQSLAYIQDII